MYRLSNRQQRSICGTELDDERLAQRRVRNAIAQHDPALVFVSHVDGLVTVDASLVEDGHGTIGGVIAEDASGAARWIFGAAKADEERGADRDPQDVDRRKHSAHGPYNSDSMTRGEIEQKLIDIVRQEKHDLPDDKLTPGTTFADAGIDSLDALTILFAIEETFKISIPDDRARAMKTLGDMIDAVEALLPSAM